MNRYDVALKRSVPEPSPVTKIEGVNVNSTDLRVNLKKLKLTSKDVLLVQPQKLATAEELHVLFDLLSQVNSTRTEPIFVMVLNAGIDLKTMPEEELEKMGLVRKVSLESHSRPACLVMG